MVEDEEGLLLEDVPGLGDWFKDSFPERASSSSSLLLTPASGTFT